MMNHFDKIVREMKKLYGDVESHSGNEEKVIRKPPSARKRPSIIRSRKKVNSSSPKRVSLLTERQHQIRVVNWARKRGIIVVSSPNEGQRSYKSGAILKMMGLSPGYPDLFVPEGRGGYFGCYIEMKQDRKYSDSEKNTSHWLAQNEWISYLNEKGYKASFAFGWEEGVKILEEYYKLKETKVNLTG